MIDYYYRYASSTFEVSKAQNLLDECYEQMWNLKTLIQKEPRLFNIILNPIIERPSKLSLIQSFVKEYGFNSIMHNLIVLVVTHYRWKYISKICDSFIEIYAKSKGHKVIRLITAKSLQAEKLEMIQTEIEAQLGTSIVLESKVSEDILGGIILDCDSKIIDFSWKRKLDFIKVFLQEKLQSLELI